MFAHKERHDSMTSNENSTAESDCCYSDAGSPLQMSDSGCEPVQDSGSPGTDKPQSKKQRLLQSLKHNNHGMEQQPSTGNWSYHQHHQHHQEQESSSDHTTTSIIHSRAESTMNELNLINNNLSKSYNLSPSPASSFEEEDEGKDHHLSHGQAQQHLYPSMSLPASSNGVATNNSSHRSVSQMNLNYIHKLTSSIEQQQQQGSGAGKKNGFDSERENHLMDGIRAVMTSTESVEEKQMKLNEMILQLQSLKETLASQRAESGVSY